MNKRRTLFSYQFILIIFAVYFSADINAQVTIGSQEDPTSGAVLDLSKVSSSNLGLMLPRVSLTNLSSWFPLSGTPVNGMLVYNINEETGAGLLLEK